MLVAPDISRVKDRITELAGRQKNVRIEEIEWVINQLSKFGYTTDATPQTHGVFFTVNDQHFSVCTHHTGSSQVRSCYVRQFLNAMAALELY